MTPHSCFNNWKEFVFNNDYELVSGLEAAVNRLECIFDPLLCNQLLEIKAGDGLERDLLKQKVAVQADQYKAKHDLLPTLSSEQKTQARDKRRELEESLDKLMQFHDDLEETLKQVENLMNSQESNVQIERTVLQDKFKVLDSIAQEAKELEVDIKEKKNEKTEREERFESTRQIDRDIKFLEEERELKYDEFLAKQPSLVDFNRQFDVLEVQTKEFQEVEGRVNQSKVVIEHIQNNILSIVVTLVAQSSERPMQRKMVADVKG